MRLLGNRRSPAETVHVSGVSRVEERSDVGMLLMGCGRDLLNESIGAEDGSEFRLEDLDGYPALVPQVLRRCTAYRPKPSSRSIR